MKVRFTDSIASTEGWSYGVGRKVTVGSAFTEDEIPQEKAEEWLVSGLVEPVNDGAERAVAAPGERTTRERTGSKGR